jgi:DNA segregation ATPase FtsK/SpoIIIE, S-DNA-T family
VNGHERPVNSTNGVNDPSTELERKVFDAEFLDDDAHTSGEPASGPHQTPRGKWSELASRIGVLVRRVWQADAVVRVRSVAAYRVRKIPQDVVRLVWFVVRGNWRWLVKAWSWATYADLRADARNARLAGDSETRRKAQELIRADATARWARVGIVLRRALVTCRVAGPVAVVLWVVDSWMDRADMWAWLAAVYAVLDALWTVATAVVPVVVVLVPVVWLVGAAFEGRDKSPGAGWLIHPDRDDADSWIDERMISRALAHLGIAPLTRFFKDGGELVYTVPARKDGDGTFAQVRLPLGVTADMVAGHRAKVAANLGRAALETWPTKGDEDGILDLWVADKGTLNGGAGPWPLLDDGDRVDVFEGVPFGLSQRGLIINAPLIGANWLIGGRPGQGKSSALRTLMLGAVLDPTAELWAFVLGESPDFEPFAPRLARYGMGMDDVVAEAATQALADLVSDMERRGKVLGEQPGRPPKVSRRLAEKRGLGLHPLVCAIDECHELFHHPKYGKHAAELAVRLIKRGRKYGIALLLATQSPTKDSLPREVTRNVACGVAFSVADQVANDGLLGSGRYAAGVRATELRMHTDRGTCVAVGLTSATFELVRTFYVPFEDGADDVSPVVARAMQLLAEERRSIGQVERLELGSAPADHLADIAEVMRGERRVRTQVVLARLADLNAAEYEAWTFSTLTGVLAEYGIAPRKSDGVKVLRAEEIEAAFAERDQTEGLEVRDRRGRQGELPGGSLAQGPPSDLRELDSGTQSLRSEVNRKTAGNDGPSTAQSRSLPEEPDGSL